MSKLHIFDVDGTILDSMKMWETLGSTYLKSKGCREFEKVDRIMEQMVMALFADIKSIPEQELITHQYVQRTNEHLATLSQLQSLKVQKEKELASYKSEVYKSIQGKSTWSQELLSELIQDLLSFVKSKNQKF